MTLFYACLQSCSLHPSPYRLALSGNTFQQYPYPDSPGKLSDNPLSLNCDGHDGSGVVLSMAFLWLKMLRQNPRPDDAATV